MLRWQLLLLPLLAQLLCEGPETVEASDSDLVSFPYENKPCTCTLLTCNCCQGFVVNPIKMEKKVCIKFALKILPLKLDLTINLDDRLIIEFSIDPKNPPTYCIPIPLPMSVAMCLKVHDTKLIGLSALQVCSTFYVSFNSDQIFDYKFPCVKLSGDGIDTM